MNGSYKEKITSTFNNFNKDKLHLLKDFYSSDVVFRDPVVTTKGLDQLTQYYSEAYKNVVQISFDFKKMDCFENTYYCHWIMTLQARGLNGGKSFPVEGLSEIIFNSKGLVTYHRDFVDLGSMVYEKIPLVGKVISAIKSKLAHGLN